MDRRTFIGLAATFPWWKPALAANVERGLFWRVSHPPAADAIVFGYGRIAASKVADIVADGTRLVGESKRVFVDINPNIKLPDISLDGAPTEPAMPSLKPETERRLHAALAARPDLAENAEKVIAFVLVISLLGEGQRGNEPLASAAIVGSARDAGKPVSALLDDSVVLANYRPPSLAELNSRLGEDVISALLDIRDRVGPIGAYQDQLYAERRTRELIEFGAQLSALGTLQSTDLFDEAAMKQALEEAFLLQTGGGQEGQIFVMLPVGIVAPAGGLLDRLEARGATVKAIA